MSRQFPGKKFQMASKYMKICSIFSIIREMQIKITILADKNFDNTVWMKVRETDALTHYWLGCEVA